jgi:hypothetical protein
MRIDLNKYSVNREFIQKEYAKDKTKDITRVISSVGAGIHCPLIALCFYLAESEGFTPQLTKMINSLVKFYGYAQISGQPANSPYLHLS